MFKSYAVRLSHPYSIALFIFLLALTVRVYFLPFSLLRDQPFDPTNVAFDGYYWIANNILAGNGFSGSVQAPYVPDDIRMPLYPLLIAGILKIFGSTKALFVLQALIGSATAVLAWIVAKEFLSTRWSAAVGFAMALEPLGAYLTSTMLSETVFTAVFVLAIYFFLQYLKDKRLAILTLTIALLGVATLIRPTTQYVPIIMLAILFWNSSFLFNTRLVKEVCIVLGLFIVILSPWIYRNYLVFGSTELNVQAASTLYAYFVPSTIALEKGISYEEAAKEFFEREHSQGIGDVTLANASDYKQRAFAELRKHPKGLIESVLVTQYAFFTNDGLASVLSRRGIAISFAHPPYAELITHPLKAMNFFWELAHGPGVIVILGRFFWIAVTLLAAAGAFLFWRQKGLLPQFVYIVALIAYFALTTSIIGPGVNGRLRVPVEPLIFIFAAFALERVFRKPDASFSPHKGIAL